MTALDDRPRRVRDPRRRRVRDPRRRIRGRRRQWVRAFGRAVAAVVNYVQVCVLMFVGMLAGLVVFLVLPSSTGSVRGLIGLAAIALGGYVGWWLADVARRTAVGLVDWSAASRAAHERLPASPYFRYDRDPDVRANLLTTAMGLAVPAMIVCGPVVGTLSLLHGLSDQRLVAVLRQDGMPVTGSIVWVPPIPPPGCLTTCGGTYLMFKTRAGRTVTAPAPEIGGDPSPGRAHIVYDPASPRMAALAVQIRGSPWAGAPTANVIAGALLTVALPVLIWRLIRRLRATLPWW